MADDDKKKPVWARLAKSVSGSLEKDLVDVAGASLEVAKTARSNLEKNAAALEKIEKAPLNDPESNKALLGGLVGSVGGLGSAVGREVPVWARNVLRATTPAAPAERAAATAEDAAKLSAEHEIEVTDYHAAVDKLPSALQNEFIEAVKNMPKNRKQIVLSPATIDALRDALEDQGLEVHKTIKVGGVKIVPPGD